MPDRPEDTAGGRTLFAMGERVAVVETKVAGLKDDTTVIRANIHNINNDIMAMRVIETRCADALEALQAILTTRAAQVDLIAANVNTLLVAKGSSEGVWAATIRIASAFVASIGILGALGAIAAWALDHLKVR